MCPGVSISFLTEILYVFGKMIPIHKLLSRIRWDKDFGKGSFEIGYYDRLEDKILRIPLRDIYFEEGDHYFICVIDQHHELHHVPLHRIKAVYRNGEIIWRRK